MNYLVYLSEEEKNNLMAFLARATMNGNEAITFVNLMLKLQNTQVLPEGNPEPAAEE